MEKDLKTKNGQSTAGKRTGPKWTCTGMLVSLLLFAMHPAEAREYASVRIADPYIEMHTGPGRGYPVFNVEERDAWIQVIKRKTDWFKVRTENGKEGWVSREQLQQTLSPGGAPVRIEDASLAEFTRHRIEFGAIGGSFETSDVMTVYGAYAPTPKLSAELSASKIFSDFADAEMANLSLAIHPFPNWRVSPFFTLGTGIIRTNPNVTLVQEKDRVDQLGNAGVGARVYLTRRFIFRAQYKHYVIFQSVDDNQEIDEWSAGFAVFF